MTLSIVTTLYCSAPHLKEFYRRASAAAETIASDYEIVFVNDGSPDDSLLIALELFERDPRVRVVDLARNFGHHKAMMTGLAPCPRPARLPDRLGPRGGSGAADGVCRHTRQRRRADVVYGVQAERRGDWFERWSGRIFFKLFNLMSDYPIPENLVTVRLMTRRYVSALLSHGEREMVISGLWVLTGFRQVPIAVTKHSRSKTTYSLRRKVAVLVNSVTSFSSRPLVFIFYLGVVIGALAAAAAAVPGDPPGLLRYPAAGVAVAHRVGVAPRRHDPGLPGHHRHLPLENLHRDQAASLYHCPQCP